MRDYVPIRFYVVPRWDGGYAIRDKHAGSLLPERFERRIDAQRQVRSLRQEQIAAVTRGGVGG